MIHRRQSLKASSIAALLVITPTVAVAHVQNTSQPNSTNEYAMKITIGDVTFTATLEDNATAEAFKARLPLTLKMSDLNNNEKVTRLSKRLPANDSNPGHIQTGDLMIWSSSSLVLFYKSFPTPYSYTRLGRIDNTEGFSAAVGTGNVTITFELE